MFHVVLHITQKIYITITEIDIFVLSKKQCKTISMLGFYILLLNMFKPL